MTSGEIREQEIRLRVELEEAEDRGDVGGIIGANLTTPPRMNRVI